MTVYSTLQTPIATKLINDDGTINHVWNEFFVRLMKNAGVTVSIADLETSVADLETEIDSIGEELAFSITMTDSDSNLAATLAVLYDGNKSSNGVEYIVNGSSDVTDSWIQYKYGVTDYIDRVAVYTSNANGRVYIGYSVDGTSWSFLQAEADHTLTSEGKLETATSQGNARTNYLQLVSGTNIAIFPNNIFAKYIKIYFTGSYTTTVYEFIPARILISEMAAINNLATLSATFGAVGGYADFDTEFTNLVSQTDNKVSAYVQASTSTPSWSDADINHIGDMWYKTDELKWYSYNGTIWSLSDSSIFDVNTLADGKTTIHYGTTVPAGALGDIGDFYMRSNNDVITSYEKTGASTWTEIGAYNDGADVTPALPSDENLVNYWAFDEGSGMVLLDIVSGASLTLTIGDGDGWITGVSGSAYNFGTSGYALLPTYGALNKTTITITAWIKKQGSLINRGIIFDWAAGHYNLLFGYDNGADIFQFYIGDGTNSDAITNSTLVNDVWCFVAGVFDASINELSLWVNGVKATKTTTITNIGSSPSASSRIGAAIDGAIDELRIYDTALSDQEIKALYLNPGGNKTLQNALVAQATLEDIASDAKITPVEKLTLKPIWDAIVLEATLTTGSIPVSAAALSVDDSTFDSKYAALYAYVITTLDVFSSMTTATSITRTTWDTAFKEYYDARIDLLNAIAAKAATLAVWSSVTGTGKPDDNATDNSDLATGYTTIVGDVISVFSNFITVTAGTNDELDWIEDSTTFNATLTPSTTYTPVSLAAHVQTIMRAESGADTNTTVTYSTSTRKITIANSTLTTLSLLWNTGTNAVDSCAGVLGFSTAADSTGALTYTGNIQTALRVKIGDLS